MEIAIGINESNRKEISIGLSKVLADTYTLYLKTQNFHWNVTGPMFQSLHLQFDAQYKELFDAVDLIAERIRALGFYAPASFTEFCRLSSIKEPTRVPSARDMIAELVDGHEAVARTARSVFDLADAAKDEATADLLTDRLLEHEKQAWMLRSHLENTA